MPDVYRYVLDLFRTTGEPLGQAALTPDWEPAVECARLTGLRKFGAWATQSGAERGIEPVWHADLGEPYLSAFRVLFTAAAGPEWSEDFPATRYFAESAREAIARLVEAGTLSKGDRAVYRIAAFAQDHGETAPSRLSFDAADSPPPLGLRRTAIGELLRSSASCADPDDRDVEVLLPQWAVDEATVLTREAGPRETGGILIGHLHRDPETLEILVEVTAQIPARHTTGDAVKLTFTSETWTDVRHAIALRRRDEIMLGWWHSHPAIEWCKECSPESQRVCRLAAGFLSADDKALHRAMFPRAFSLALVMTHALAGVSATLFGWRSGLLERRGFRLLGHDAADAQRAAAQYIATRVAEEDTEDIVTGGPHAAPAG